jgi:hypothetical protein
MNTFLHGPFIIKLKLCIRHNANKLFLPILQTNLKANLHVLVSAFKIIKIIANFITWKLNAKSDSCVN